MPRTTSVCRSSDHLKLVTQQMVLISVPVEDLISSRFFSYSGSSEISHFSTIELSHCQNWAGDRTLAFSLLGCLTSTTSLVGTSLPEFLSQQLSLALRRVVLPGDRDAFQPAATEHLTLKVSSGLWIRKGLC